VHGDTPGAAALAGAIRRGLEDAGVTVARLTR
jgi:lactam utilization protein B